MAEGNERRVGRRARRIVDRERARGNLHVSVVSLFELTALHAARRIDLAPSADEWIRESIEDSGLRVVDLTSRIALTAGLIPAAVVPDPFDRLIIASAVHADVPLLTRDDRILDYARDTRAVRVVDAAK
jgi:PIN domain nuclease of toxin-antitoxin system